MSLIPKTYDAWEHCITVECGISLTADYVAERIDALQNDNDYQTQKFVALWGEDQRTKTLEWFRQAASKLKSETV